MPASTVAEGLAPPDPGHPYTPDGRGKPRSYQIHIPIPRFTLPTLLEDQHPSPVLTARQRIERLVDLLKLIATRNQAVDIDLSL